jgi:GntR family transcriptional regulator, transcriptional repressor for pyruvate dehydrogenase complex
MTLQTPIGLEDGALTGALVRRIQDMIHSGELAVGQKLPPERQLVQMLGVSRSSVRQAVKSLESMGIVVSRVGVGNFINPNLSTSSLLHGPMRFAIKLNNISRRQLYEMRQVVEAHVVALAAERATASDLEKIQRILDEMASQAGDAKAMADCDHRFHMAVLDACGNDIFRLLFEPVSKLLWEDLAERMSLFDPKQTWELHYGIYDAIRRRDKESAVREMKRHLEIGYQAFFGSEG